ncbi:MAG TPA: hypothetical protein ENH05_03205 [Rhizobiales bacterium]|nr:hypothetical protein [Hyphomicrobiales bacterium]
MWSRMNAALGRRCVGALLIAGLPFYAGAQTPAGDPAALAPAKPKHVLTPEEAREKAQRKICKIQICGIFASRAAQGADIDCPIVKTWRESDIEDIISGGKLDWPWGKARCATRLRIKRSDLAAAAAAGITVKLGAHTLACSLDLKSEGESYDVKVGIAPEVTFANGRATAAQINWGAIDAPLLAYGVIWPGAKLDNSLNVLGGQVVKMTNEFMGRKCAALKDETALPSTHQ